MEIKVLIASRSPAICAEIENQLAAGAGIRIVGVAHDGADVLDLTAGQRPDVLVYHTASCGKPQLELLKQLQNVHPALKTLALECSPEHIRAYFIRMAAWGLRGCICQWRDSSELIDAVRSLSAGDFYLCPLASQALVDAYRNMMHQVAREEA